MPTAWPPAMVKLTTMYAASHMWANCQKAAGLNNTAQVWTSVTSRSTRRKPTGTFIQALQSPEGQL